MLIRMAFGFERGHVIDFPPHEARAMLADGRAALPDASASVGRVPDPAILTARVEMRQDRIDPRAKHRRHR